MIDWCVEKNTKPGVSDYRRYEVTEGLIFSLPSGYSVSKKFIDWFWSLANQA